MCRTSVTTACVYLMKLLHKTNTRHRRSRHREWARLSNVSLCRLPFTAIHCYARNPQLNIYIKSAIRKKNNSCRYEFRLYLPSSVRRRRTTTVRCKCLDKHLFSLRFFFVIYFFGGRFRIRNDKDETTSAFLVSPCFCIVWQNEWKWCKVWASSRAERTHTTKIECVDGWWRDPKWSRVRRRSIELAFWCKKCWRSILLDVSNCCHLLGTKWSATFSIVHIVFLCGDQYTSFRCN